MHWLPRELAVNNDGVWRSDLLGGGRVLAFIDRLKKFRTLGQYADEMGWDHGEGYIVGKTGVRKKADHITGHFTLPSEAITSSGIDHSRIKTEKATLFKSDYTPKRFTPPMLLIREHMDLFRDVWTKHYLTYKNKVVGFSASKSTDASQLLFVDKWINSECTALRAYVAAISVRLFTQKATTLSGIDIERLPFPGDLSLSLSKHEHILVADIVDHYRDLIRLGDDSTAMKEAGEPGLPAFNEVFTARINGVYKKNKLQALPAQIWPGVICQPYIFGRGKVDWNGADELKAKVDALLREKRGGGLNITRIARLYDGACIYLLKPDRLRYWLRSVALRDADETLADLDEQGF